MSNVLYLIGSACCMVEVQPTSGTSALPASPPPGTFSIVFCGKSLPCPEHGEPSQQQPLTTYATVATTNASSETSK